VPAPSPSAYHSWTTVPPSSEPSSTRRDVDDVSVTHSSSPRDRPAPTTSTVRARAAEGSARPSAAGTRAWLHPGSSWGSVNVRPASRDPTVEVGTGVS